METMTRDNKAGSEDYHKSLVRRIKALGTVGADVADLELLQELAAELAAATEAQVITLRADGFTWQQIGDQLGITKAAAYKRYGHLA